MADREKQNLQSAEVMGKLFGITPRYVRMLTGDGVLTAVKVKNKNMYDLLPTVQTYIRYLTVKAEEKAKNSDDVQAESDKLKAEADLKRYKADMAKMQLKELEAEMHQSEDVEAMTNDLIYTIREKIEALPDRLASDVVGTSNANEVSVLIRSECYKLLSELAGYQYDPAAYKRRLRDNKRRGDLGAIQTDE